MWFSFVRKWEIHKIFVFLLNKSDCYFAFPNFQYKTASSLPAALHVHKNWSKIPLQANPLPSFPHPFLPTLLPKPSLLSTNTHTHLHMRTHTHTHTHTRKHTHAHERSIQNYFTQGLSVRCPQFLLPSAALEKAHTWIIHKLTGCLVREEMQHR